MNLETIIPQLSSRGISLSELVYSQSSTHVYKGSYQSFPAAIKLQSLLRSPSPSALEAEFQTMISLSHPNLLRVYDCFWPSQDCFVLCTEWCSKDLGKDMQHRRTNSYPWQESDLWEIVRMLVSALAYMQRSNVAHRDVKPANIFYEIGHCVKVGDFGTATSAGEGCMTAAGTLLYCSPKLRAALKQRRDAVTHNVFKSDVFSLGVTMLEIASLQTPNVFLTLGITQGAVDCIVDSLVYSLEFKEMLKAMLRVEEDQRPDFVQIEAWLNPQETLLEVKPVTQARAAPSEPSQCQYASTDRQKPAPSQSPVQPSEKVSLPEPKCLHCFRPVDRFSPNSEFEVVQLECDPDRHMFCSRSCFVAWGLQQVKINAECPKCGQIVSADVFNSYQMMEKTEASDGERYSNEAEEEKEYAEERMMYPKDPREVVKSRYMDEARSNDPQSFCSCTSFLSRYFWSQK